jgi:hypothetical protein
MKKSIILGLVVIVILAIGILLAYPEGRTKEESPAVITAGQFLDALIGYDVNKAKELSAGSILANLSNTNRLGENNSGYSEYIVVSKTINILSENENWAKLYAEVETKDRKTGRIDVHWYEIYLIENENNWRIYRLEETEVMNGKEQKILPQNIEDIAKVFGQYVTLLSQNKYDEAGELLIGKARTAHEQTKSFFNKSPLIKYYKNINIEPLYYDGSVILAKAQYRVDGRDVVLTVSFFQTSEGWRIFNVSQI